MNLFLRVEPGEMKRAINLYEKAVGIYYMGDDLNELELWLKEERKIPIYLHFLQYIPDYPCNNVILNSPHPLGDEYVFYSLNGVLQALISNSRPFNLFFMKDDYLSIEEYYLRVGDLMMCLAGEEGITCWIEVKNIEELVSLKIRGIQNFLVSVTMLDFLKN